MGVIRIALERNIRLPLRTIRKFGDELLSFFADRLKVALREKGVPFDLHVYEKGAHGIGLGSRPYGGGDPHPWARDCIFWLKGHGWAKSE